MKIVTEPKVTVIAKQVFLGHPEYEIPDDGNDAVKIGAFAAKGCYDSFGADGRANEKNQATILEHQHGSVLEHINFTLYIEGISRALSLESNRHRPLAISQRSTRYTAEEDAAIVLDPYYSDLYKKYELFLTDPTADDISGVSDFDIEELNIMAMYLQSLSIMLGDYQYHVEWLMMNNRFKLEGFDLRKWARGKARNLLPHAIETKITYTGNVRAWRWFIESRSDRHAEGEIRRLAHHVLMVLKEEAPLYFDDFEVVGEFENIPEYKPKYRKV